MSQWLHLRKAIADAVATTKWPIAVSVRGAQDFATKVRSIPELPCGFAEDVFRQLRTAKDLALLRECNADLEELTTLSAQVSQFSARADLLIGVETSSLQALVNELKELEFAGLTLEGIKEATEDRRKKTESFEEALPGAQRLAELFGIADASIDDLGSMTRAIVMLQQVPRNALQLRHPSVVAEENIAVFERGLLQAEASHGPRIVCVQNLN